MKEKDVKKEEHPLHHNKVTHHQNIEPRAKLWVMAIVLGLLIIVTGIQSMELVGLKDKLNNEVSTLTVSGGSAPTVSTGQSSGSLANNLQNLPTMVGGC